MASVTTEIVSGSKVKIAWLNPDDRGDTITSYQILIKKKDSSFAEDLNNCDGSDSTIMT